MLLCLDSVILASMSDPAIALTLIPAVY